MAGPLLDEKILLLQEALGRAGVPHAFGGALALAYYATPRATIDIDVNVFVSVERADEVLAALAPLGVEPPTRAERERLERDAQARVRWGHTPVDLFFAYDPLHDACLERRRRMPFGDGAELDVLSAEDLAVFKVVFDRPKDWTDLAELLYAQAGDFDAGYVRGWLGRLVGPDDPRYARFEDLLRA